MGVWQTREGLISDVGLRTVEALAGDQSQPENAALATKAVETAEAEVAAYIQGRYPELLGKAHPTLTIHVNRLALWALLSAKGYEPGSPDESIKIDRDSSLTFLGQVASGRVSLVSGQAAEGEAQADNAPVTAVHPRKLLPPDFLDRY